MTAAGLSEPEPSDVLILPTPFFDDTQYAYLAEPKILGLNLSLPCCHYFQVLNAMTMFKFNLGIIRAWYVIPYMCLRSVLSCFRWYQDPMLDLCNMPTFIAQEAQY